MPDISVIIPAYNRAELIGKTLRSLLYQSLPAKEIIIVDDGSTDGTAEMAEKEFSVFSEQFSGNSQSKIQNPEFIILRQQNAGPGAARNRGLAEASGELIHFFDSDDIAAPNKHEVQWRALLETGADIAYGPWVKGRFAPQYEGGEEFSIFNFQFSGFSAEGPVLQARGLPQGDLIKALLTNWSIVPHACLFRRSILEKAGGFPEDIWVGEDQLLFLRCLLAGAKVVHTPGTVVFYRVGNDPAKLTAPGAAQKRHARDWGRFLLKANQELSAGGWRVASAGALRADDVELRSAGGNQFADSLGFLKGQSQAGLQMDSQKLQSIRAANDPSAAKGHSSSVPIREIRGSNSYILDSFTTPLAWFGFRLRAYEAWRDLGRFFPDGEGEVKMELQGIWKRNPFSAFRFQCSGFVLRKLGGLKWRVLGYRENASFRCERPSLRAGQKIEVRPS